MYSPGGSRTVEYREGELRNPLGSSPISLLFEDYEFSISNKPTINAVYTFICLFQACSTTATGMMDPTDPTHKKVRIMLFRAHTNHHEMKKEEEKKKYVMNVKQYGLINNAGMKQKIGKGMAAEIFGGTPTPAANPSTRSAKDEMCAEDEDDSFENLEPVIRDAERVDELKGNGKKIGEGVREMFQSFERESPTFINFFKKENESKNRYPTEIFLYDKIRVILNDGTNSTSAGDYYHVDRREQPKHYVLAQAPFTSETEIDFYRFVTTLKSDMIIFLMKFEGDAAKFLPPYSKDETKSVGPFTIKVTHESIKDKNFECILLSILIFFHTFSLIITKI